MLGVEGTMSGTRMVGTASATKRREVTISLPHSGWADGKPEYSGYGVACTAQGAGKLTFTAQWEPDRDLTVTAVIRT